MENHEITISQNGSLLVYQNGYDCAFIQQTIDSENLNGLRIWTDLMTDPPKDLGFLSECGFLEALDVTALLDYDFGFLKDLPNLKRLSINTEGKSEIDLANQTALEYLAIEWRKGKIRGLEKCGKLTSLGLIDYSERDLHPVSCLHNLTALRIKTASITTLSGVDDLTQLESLLLGNCRKLVSICAINGLKRLKVLEIESCRNISDYEELTDLTSLENLRLTNCGDIASINFAKNFQSLRRLDVLGNTKILNGGWNANLKP